MSRYQFRYVLLTYAQCGDLDPFEVCNHLASLNAECIIGRESHEDGGTHLHVFADFGTKFRSRNVRIFDVGGYHPNVSPSKGRPGEGWDYATKEGNIVAGGLERPGSGGSTGGRWTGHSGGGVAPSSLPGLPRTLVPRFRARPPPTSDPVLSCSV